tara:strand:+ start:7033 stop:8430 length:1398 start_codon:yes stop_codon:yes gene_type:complete
MLDQYQNIMTIAAISTAVSAGQGGVAIIRISGDDALEVGQNLVSIKGDKEWNSHTILYGNIYEDDDNKNLIDEILVLIMKSPKSFTGEDVIEIHCHGGLISVQRILKKVLSHQKVRRALPGEFTQRAVLNGKIDLTKAEAISEIIGASSIKAAKLAVSGLDGGIQKIIEYCRDKLITQLAEIEARVDFEEDLPPLSKIDISKEINKIKHKLNEIINSSDKVSCIRKGLKIGLIGSPNVGKSSLINHLSRRELSIVTSVPGTTRDIIKNDIDIEGVPLTLIDTAGIHSTKDEVEKIGISKSKEVMQKADLIILIFDLSCGWTNNDQKLIDQAPDDINILVVGNKSDICLNSKENKIVKNNKKISPIVNVSALTGEGDQELKEQILKKCNANDLESQIISLNQRQCDLAKSAVDSLDKMEDIMQEDLPFDFWTIDLRDAIDKLGEITGKVVTEELLDNIFSRFCIGK